MIPATTVYIPATAIYRQPADTGQNTEQSIPDSCLPAYQQTAFVAATCTSLAERWRAGSDALLSSFAAALSLLHTAASALLCRHGGS
jgi:hypothetical protein